MYDIEIGSGSKPIAYSTEELLNCICECMAESLPDDWQRAFMQATVEGNDIDASFRFFESGSDEEQRFIPSNSIAPMNAAMELQALMRREGDDWNSIRVTIYRDGRFEYETR